MKTILRSALAVMSLLLFFACGGSKPSSSAQAAEDGAPMLGTTKVDSLKQAAEAAEWEAHRLREELNRKQNAP